MQILHESGRRSNHDGIIEVDGDNDPVRILLKSGEVRKIYKSNKGYWFTYNSNRFYLDDVNLKNEKKFIKLHPKQCRTCAGLQKDNKCLSPDGPRGFKGHTKQDCSYFQEKPVME